MNHRWLVLGLVTASILAATSTAAFGVVQVAELRDPQGIDNPKPRPSWKQQFADPDNEYKPKPLWFISGELTTEEIQRQLKDAKELAGFTGVSPLPNTDVLPTPFSSEYYERYRDIVETARAYVPEMKEKGADIIIA